MKNLELFNGNIYDWNNSNLANFSYPKFDLNNIDSCKEFIKQHYTRSFDWQKSICNNIKLYNIKSKNYIKNENLLYNVYADDFLMELFWYDYLKELFDDFTKFTGYSIYTNGRSNGYLTLNYKRKFVDFSDYYASDLYELNEDDLLQATKDLLLFDYYSNLIVEYYFDFCNLHVYSQGYINETCIKQIKDYLLNIANNNDLLKQFSTCGIEVLTKDNKKFTFNLVNVDELNKYDDYSYLCLDFENNIININSKDLVNKKIEILEYIVKYLDYITVIKVNNE